MKKDDKKPMIISHQPVHFETNISKNKGDCGDGGGGGGYAGGSGCWPPFA